MMDNIFISYYKGFAQAKARTPFFAAVSVLSLVFVGFFILAVVSLKRQNFYDLTKVPGFTQYYIFGHLALLTLLYWHYKRKNLAGMLSAFDEKEINRRQFWAILSGFILLLPFITIIAILA